MHGRGEKWEIHLHGESYCTCSLENRFFYLMLNLNTNVEHDPKIDFNVWWRNENVVVWCVFQVVRSLWVWVYRDHLSYLTCQIWPMTRKDVIFWPIQKLNSVTWWHIPFDRAKVTLSHCPFTLSREFSFGEILRKNWKNTYFFRFFGWKMTFFSLFDRQTSIEIGFWMQI